MEAERVDGAAASLVTARSSDRSPAKRPAQEIETAQSQPLPPAENPNAVAKQMKFFKYNFGVKAWKQWAMKKNADTEKSSKRRSPFNTELFQMTADELNHYLCLFVKEARKPNGKEYAADKIFYFVLGIQQYLHAYGRSDNIFCDPYYEQFTDCLDKVVRGFPAIYKDSAYFDSCIKEEHLWECKQFGTFSPHALLNTLMLFNIKNFGMSTVEEHMQLSFTDIMKHWHICAERNGASCTVFRYCNPKSGPDAYPFKVYELRTNRENLSRCPVRLYEFYLSKCPKHVKKMEDVFYMQPEPCYAPDSPIWYSKQALSQDALQKMFHRLKMVNEIYMTLQKN